MPPLLEAQVEHQTVLETIRERGYLLRFENTDAWFATHDRLPQSLPEALDGEDIATDDAQALIDAGLVRPKLQYSLDGGTLVLVFALAEQTQQAGTAAG